MRVVREGRAVLTGELTKLGCRVFPSQSNSSCSSFRRTAPNAASLFEDLLRRGIILRPLTSYACPGTSASPWGRLKKILCLSMQCGNCCNHEVSAYHHIGRPRRGRQIHLAKRLATILGIPYLDTGAMFRTIALRLGPGAEALPEDELRARCKAFRFKLQGGGEHSVLLCNGVPVGPEIRTEEVGRLASRLATSTVVRDCLKEAQRSLGESRSRRRRPRHGDRGVPHARFKFFLDARPEVRGMRRFEELQAKGEPADLAQITEMIRNATTWTATGPLRLSNPPPMP